MSDKAIVLSRLEMQWLHRQVVAARDRLEGKLKEKEDTDVRNDYEFFAKASLEMSDRLNAGDKERLGVMNMRIELEEALELCEEPEAILEAESRLKTLPTEEQYRLLFGRDQLKFTIKLLDKDIQWLYGKAIPNYEKREASEYSDKVMTKTYYINKAKKAKEILSNLKARLEREL